MCAADGLLQPCDGQAVFPAHVDVAPGSANGQPADDHALQEKVRLPLHDDAVLERARFALVRIADHVALCNARRVGGGAALDSRGEPGAAVPQDGPGELLNDFARVQGESLPESSVSAGGRVGIDVQGRDLAKVP